MLSLAGADGSAFGRLRKCLRLGETESKMQTINGISLSPILGSSSEVMSPLLLSYSPTVANRPSAFVLQSRSKAFSNGRVQMSHKLVL